MGTPIYVTRLYRMVQDDGSLLWPERFTYEWLMSKRAQMGTGQFNAEFQNNPIDPSTQKFRPEWVGWYTSADLNYVKGVLTWGEKPLRICMGVDQAIEEREDKNLDETAIVILGVTAQREALVLHQWSDRVDFPKQVAMVRQLAQHFSVSAIGIERDAYQLALSQQIVKEGWLPVIPLHNTRPKYERITGLSPAFEQGRFYLRRCTDDESGGQMDDLKQVRLHPTMEKLYLQLTQYPASPHDDILDAMVNATVVATGERMFGKFF